MPHLPEHLAGLYKERREEIVRRLGDFASVPEDRWFYELCFCLCTPQSSAVHAAAVQKELEDTDFLNRGQDVLHMLRSPDRYIRFHNTKHTRLHLAREQWPIIHDILVAPYANERERRDVLASTVNGFGLKEASHFLRNIGRRGLAIIDRHLLTNMVASGLYDEIPSVSTPQRYRQVEEAYSSFCESIGIDMDEIDLLFWCAQTGHILK